MDRRRHARVAAEFSVQVWGLDSFSQPFAQLARVKNISFSGMVVHGMSSTVSVGAVLEIKYEREKAAFRVVWVGEVGSSRQGEIGLAKLAEETPLLDFQPVVLHACAGRG
jgi:hypothetical protein